MSSWPFGANAGGTGEAIAENLRTTLDPGIGAVSAIRADACLLRFHGQHIRDGDRARQWPRPIQGRQSKKSRMTRFSECEFPPGGLLPFEKEGLTETPREARTLSARRAATGEPG